MVTSTSPTLVGASVSATSSHAVFAERTGGRDAIRSISPASETYVNGIGRAKSSPTAALGHASATRAALATGSNEVSATSSLSQLATTSSSSPLHSKEQKARRQYSSASSSNSEQKAASPPQTPVNVLPTPCVLSSQDQADSDKHQVQDIQNDNNSTDEDVVSHNVNNSIDIPIHVNNTNNACDFNKSLASTLIESPVTQAKSLADSGILTLESVEGLRAGSPSQTQRTPSRFSHMSPSGPSQSQAGPSSRTSPFHFNDEEEADDADISDSGDQDTRGALTHSSLGKHGPEEQVYEGERAKRRRVLVNKVTRGNSQPANSGSRLGSFSHPSPVHPNESDAEDSDMTDASATNTSGRQASRENRRIQRTRRSFPQQPSRANRGRYGSQTVRGSNSRSGERQSTRFDQDDRRNIYDPDYRPNELLRYVDYTSDSHSDFPGAVHRDYAPGNIEPRVEINDSDRETVDWRDYSGHDTVEILDSDSDVDANISQRATGNNSHRLGRDASTPIEILSDEDEEVSRTAVASGDTVNNFRENDQAEIEVVIDLTQPSQTQNTRVYPAFDNLGRVPGTTPTGFRLPTLRRITTVRGAQSPDALLNPRQQAMLHADAITEAGRVEHEPTYDPNHPWGQGAIPLVPTRISASASISIAAPAIEFPAASRSPPIIDVHNSSTRATTTALAASNAALHPLTSAAMAAFDRTNRLRQQEADRYGEDGLERNDVGLQAEDHLHQTDYDDHESEESDMEEPISQDAAEIDDRQANEGTDHILGLGTPAAANHFRTSARRSIGPIQSSPRPSASPEFSHRAARPSLISRSSVHQSPPHPHRYNPMEQRISPGNSATRRVSPVQLILQRPAGSSSPSWRNPFSSNDTRTPISRASSRSNQQAGPVACDLTNQQLVATRARSLLDQQAEPATSYDLTGQPPYHVFIVDQTPSPQNSPTQASSSSPAAQANLTVNPCSICWEHLRYPCAAPCGHTFCKECIHLSLQTKRSCPNCRKPLLLKNLQEIELMVSVSSVEGVAL